MKLLALWYYFEGKTTKNIFQQLYNLNSELILGNDLNKAFVI